MSNNVYITYNIDNTLLYNEVVLTSSEIQNDLYDNGIILVENPGSGKYVVFHEVILEYSAGTVAYTTSANNEIYINRTGIRFNKDIMVGHLENRYAVCMDYSNYVQTTAARSVGYSLNISDDYTLNCNDTFDNGNGTLKIKYYYSIRSFG